MQHDPKAILGRAIREERRKLNLSQEDFSEICDLHRTYLGAVERGEKNISLVNIIRISQALKLSVEALFGKAGL